MADSSLEPGQARAVPNQRKRKAPAPDAAAEDEAEALEESVEELEREVADLDRRILEHLRGTATRLSDAAVSRLATLRPPARLEVAVVSKTSTEADQVLEKVNILKSKTQANISDLPKLLEKINETVARCQKVANQSVNVDPVFRCFKGIRRV